VRCPAGKYLRAEPVAALYEQGKVKHVGCFPLLEDEMCDFGINGLSSGASPDRLDATVRRSRRCSRTGTGTGRGSRSCRGLTASSRLCTGTYLESSRAFDKRANPTLGYSPT
jgi:hypothetical protein